MAMQITEAKPPPRRRSQPTSSGRNAARGAPAATRRAGPQTPIGLCARGAPSRSRTEGSVAGS